MEKQISEAFYLVIGLVVTAILITIGIVFTNEAHSVRMKGINNKAFYEELKTEREWRRYTGLKTGADVVDFIVRHKDSCDIVIRDTALSSNSKINAYLTGGSLILGLSDKKNIPNSFWKMTFVYDNIILGKGEAEYEAVLLYDGELTAGWGTTVTGMEFTRR